MPCVHKSSDRTYAPYFRDRLFSLYLLLYSYFLSYVLKEKKGSSFRDGNGLSGRQQAEDVPALTKSYSSFSGQDDHISEAQRKVHRNRCSVLFFAV